MSSYLLSLSRRTGTSFAESGGAPSLSRGIRGSSLELGVGGTPGTPSLFARFKHWYQRVSTGVGEKQAGAGRGGRAASKAGAAAVAFLGALLLVLALSYFLLRFLFSGPGHAGVSTSGSFSSGFLGGFSIQKAESGSRVSLPDSADEAMAKKKSPLDPKVGVVDVKPILEFEGGVGAANEALSKERAIFDAEPFRRPPEDKETPPGPLGEAQGSPVVFRDGFYLFGWTIPEIAFRIALPDTSRHLPHVALDRPQRVGGVMRRLGVVSLASAQHTLAIVRSGKVYSWGVDWDSQGKPAGLLGRKGPFWRPGAVDVLGAATGKPGEPIIEVAAGRVHSVALSESGKVYTWGLNNRGQLGRETPTKEDGWIPGRVVAGGLDALRIVSVSASGFYTLALADTGHIYVWGACYYTGPSPWMSGADNEASFPDKLKEEWAQAAKEAGTPRKVTEGPMGSGETDKLAAGPEHWVVLARNGQLFTASTGFTIEGTVLPPNQDFRWLGHPREEAGPTHIPQQVRGLLVEPTTAPVMVAAAKRVTIALTTNYKLVSWGAKDAGALGRRTDRMDAHYPAFVGSPDGGANSLYARTVSTIAAAEDYGMAITADGLLYSWGGNRYGQLGRAGLLSESEPGIVSALGLNSPLEPSFVVAGAHQAYALCIRRAGGPGQGEVPPDPADPGAAFLEELESPAAWGGGQADLTEDEVALAWGLASAPAQSVMPAFPVIWEESHRAELEAITKPWVEVLPKKGFERKYRNPCWHSADGALHCVPFFFVLGVPRAGVLDLYSRLTGSGIQEIAGASEAQPRWWDERSTEPFNWYSDLFSHAATLAGTAVDTITGDASETMLTNSGVQVRGETKGFLLPELVFSILPTAQMIVILRNPIDRFLSDFLVSPGDAYSKDAPGFTKMVETVLPVMEECLQKQGERDCTRQHYKDMPELVRSMYTTFIQDWFKLFDRNLFYFVKYEDYSATPKEEIVGVLKFLDLESDVGEEVWTRALDHLPVQDGANAQPQLPEVEAGTRTRLDNFFRPMNEALMHLLADRKFSWGLPPAR